MFVHVVMMRFVPDVDEAFHARVEAYARRIRAEAQGLLQYEYAVNDAERSQGYTHAVVSAFRTSADHDAYQVSAVHQEMKAFMSPAIAELAVCDSVLPDRS
ncbi:Dabb family protein [Futiania mangrovi]|uniref:Dabb family protein n=1 Tax=Futiania mangrovi TaxID=2959716 RepID=A0A9J6PEK5_9PROT|nr:Dabb family protein [Futiania mangrovii]MCP1337853.1 Dabb family protein [Futiania mangrovii]